MIKICCTCHISKDETHFGRLTNSEDGLRSECRECRREYRKKNAEFLSEKRKQHYLLNKDKEKEKQKIDANLDEYIKKINPDEFNT